MAIYNPILNRWDYIENHDTTETEFIIIDGIDIDMTVYS